MGRSPLIARLLVWALALVVIDAAVIATDKHDQRATWAAKVVATPSSTTTTTTSTPTTTSPESTSTTLAASETTSTPAAPTTTAATPTTTADTVPPSSIANSEVVVAHLQGDDTAQTAAFTVEGRWEVRWHVVGGDGVAATIENTDQPGNPFFAPITPGDGTGDFPEGCNCTLHLEPEGSSYDVFVVDVEG